MYLYPEESRAIEEAYKKVYRTLNRGYLEKVYRNALAIELKKQGLEVDLEYPIHVYYEGEVVGDYFADILVGKHIILELKAVSALNEAHDAQLLNYLTATGVRLGYLLNFGATFGYKRRIK